MLLPCHHILKFTDLDINGTAKLLRQFNSATDITFNGGKKQESGFIVVRITTNRRVLYIFLASNTQLVKCICNNMICLFQLMH